MATLAYQRSLRWERFGTAGTAKGQGNGSIGKLETKSLLA
jgi:hypothetical protein